MEFYGQEPGDSPRGLQRNPRSEQPLDKNVRAIITKARTSWLKNVEVLDLLQNYSRYRFNLNKETPICPPGGTLYLFNRKVTRFFRRDGHNWRKKADGKTIRETHEKLKVGNKEVLNCYYAHADQDDQLQRRCYWMLDGDDSIVLVHYLAANAAARLRPLQPAPLTAANLAMQPRNMEYAPSSSDTASERSFRSETPSSASSYNDLEMARVGSAPDRLNSFTFGSGSVRRASDGRCHFTITTGNTRPGPDAAPLAQEGMGALALGASSNLGGGRDGNGAGPPLESRAGSLPSSLGEALARVHADAQQPSQGSRGQQSGFWGSGAGGGGGLAAAHQMAAAGRGSGNGGWPPPQQASASQTAEDAAAALAAWHQQQTAAAAATQYAAALAAQQQQQQQQGSGGGNGFGSLETVEATAVPPQHPGALFLAAGGSSAFGGGVPHSVGSLPWQATTPGGGGGNTFAGTGWPPGPVAAGEEAPRPRLPCAGLSAFAAPQVQHGLGGTSTSAFAAAALQPQILAHPSQPACGAGSSSRAEDHQSLHLSSLGQNQVPNPSGGYSDAMDGVRAQAQRTAAAQHSQYDYGGG